MARLGHFHHGAGAGLRDGMGFASEGLGLFGVVGSGADHAGNFLQRGAGFLDRGGLFAGAGGQRLAGSGDLPGGRGGLGGALVEVGGQVAKDAVGGVGLLEAGCEFPKD